MRLTISKKNSKIGKIPNISFPPGATCTPGVPCYRQGCYAERLYKRLPSVRIAWSDNLQLYKADPDRFFHELGRWLWENRPERFRLFVGGDFPDEEFYWRTEDLTKNLRDQVPRLHQAVQL